MKFELQKINYYSVDDKGNHLYEFSSHEILPQKKPLSKLIMRKVTKLGLPILSIKTHNRNSVYFENPVSNKTMFKQNNVVRFYCTKN